MEFLEKISEKLNKKQNDLINFLFNNDFIRKNEFKNNVEINEDYIDISFDNKRLKISYSIIIQLDCNEDYDYIIGIDAYKAFDKIKNSQIIFCCWKNISKREYNQYIKLLTNKYRFNELDGSYDYLYENYWT